MKMANRILPPLIVLVITLAIWSLMLNLKIVPEFLLPTPMQVLQSFLDSLEDFKLATWLTLKSSLIGFLVSAVVGYSIALIFSTWDLLRRAILPYAIFFQTVPIIAIAPLLVIWFGFGEPTVRASAFIVSFFPMLANSIVGLSQVDSNLSELFAAYKATRIQKLLKLQIPGSLPFAMTGLKISGGLSVVGAIVGEFVAGGGLGGLIDSARTQQRVDLVFAAIILASFIGVLIVALVQLISKCLLAWRPFYQKDLL